jgi:hypothetical protein
VKRWTAKEQMEFEELLALAAGEFDIDEALDAWRWLVPEQVKSLVLTALGDLFLIYADGSVHFLDTNAGSCAPVAASVTEWEEKIRQPELLDEWFLPGFIGALRDAGRYLSQGECYDAVHPIVLGGAWSVENFEPTHWRVHFHSLGQLHEQVKDLPTGTQITRINYTPP